MRHLMTASLCALALALPMSAKAADPVIQLTVDSGKPGATIDRHIFGQFAEQLGHGVYDGIWVGKGSSIPNTRGIRNDVVAALKAIKVPNVRWPGGCYADSYHWRDGVGEKRQTRVNTAWGNVVDSNEFGTDEYMDFIDQIDSEAYVSLNVGSGTVGEAQDWMEYVTADQPTTLAKERAANGHPAPYRVAMMGIGNESWDCGGLMTADDYTAELRKYARFVGSYNPKEPSLKIAVGPGTPDTRWTEAVMKTWKERHGWSFDIQGLSLHSYTVYDGWPPHMPATGFDEAAYAHVLQETLKMGPLIDKQSAVMDSYDPEKKIALVVDEWGAWLAPTPGTNKDFLMQQNSQRDAVIAALNINIFARRADRVRMANIAQMINVLQAMILTDGPKMVLTPTYHVFKLYVPFQDATFLPVTYDAGSYVQGNTTLPRFDAIAAKGKDGKIWLSLTNLDPKTPLLVDAAALGFKAKSASGQTLSAPKVDSINTFEKPDVVTPKAISGKLKNGAVMLTLPPASVTVVSLEP
ncbi:Intracellular exo-alpha-L-arabinofuranosidase 2 (plasmid) [Asticcacaulis sp. MM231]|uniref:alpha-N-arabinofuranosidase n=1 Tax=Asticcacaulis sp. MM231 TaxID=3157666 RepID=UPI0032D56E84